MAPVRRYLRITKHSVLECRIYVDNPALVSSWLLRPRDPVLPRVIERVRTSVLPKLMEERERASRKGVPKKQKAAISDQLIGDDFAVSLYLIETDTRHTLLHKQRRARARAQTRLVSNTSRLTGANSAAPIDVDVDVDASALRVELPDEDDIVLTADRVLVEDSDDDAARAALGDIPHIRQTQTEPQAERRSKRQRQDANPVTIDSDDDDNNDDAGSLFGDDDDDTADDPRPPTKRPRVVPVDANLADNDADDGGAKKKKIEMDVLYEGFAIYGRVLCLIVKQRVSPASSGNTLKAMLAGAATGAGGAAGASAGNTAGSTASPPQDMPVGRASMANWIASTQMPLGDTDDD